MKFSTSTMYTKLGYVYDKYQVRLDTFLCPENVEYCFQMCQWKFLSSYQNYQNDLTGIVLPNYEQSIVNISTCEQLLFLIQSFLCWLQLDQVNHPCLVHLFALTTYCWKIMPYSGKYIELAFSMKA